jgi:transcription initiation factor TFIIIB Brf1 subunit/transcription initiation factor TFIIB
VTETARALAKDLKTGLIHTPDPVEIIRIIERNEEIAETARGLLQKNLPKMSPMVVAAGLSYIAHLMRGEEISKSVIARLYGVTEVSIRTFYSRYMILNRGER